MTVGFVDIEQVIRQEFKSYELALVRHKKPTLIFYALEPIRVKHWAKTPEGKYIIEPVPDVGITEVILELKQCPDELWRYVRKENV